MTRTAFALAAIAFGSPAFAGNIAPAPLEPAPVFVEPAPAPLYDWSGFSVGAQLGYADVNGEDSAGNDSDDEGAIGGINLGYDYDFGRVVAGGSIDYNAADIDLGDDAGIDDILRVGGRVGVDSGRNLYYGTAGYARADGDEIGDSDGFFAGVGYEVFATQNLTVGTEVIYHKFDDFDDGFDAEATTAEVSLNYRF